MFLKVGVLLCDHLMERFRPISGDYPDLFCRLFEGSEVDLRFYDLTRGEEPASLHECDLWIGGGSRASVNDDADAAQRLERLVVGMYEGGHRYFGICFGHQMLARALGGVVVRSERGWGAGIHAARVVEDVSWMQPAREKLRLLMMHQDQIDTLPTGGRVLVSSDHCPVWMMAVDRHMAGVQGHPEFDPDLVGAMIRRRREQIGAAAVGDALASLDGPTDEAVLADWILEFGRA